MQVNSLVIYRGSKHAVTQVGMVGPTPTIPNGKYYSHEQCFKIHHVEAEGKKCEAGYWIPERLLTDTGEIFVEDKLIEEAPKETIGDLVREVLSGATLTISEIHTLTQKPSAAVHSFLSSALKRGEVSKSVDEKWSLVGEMIQQQD